MYAISLTSIPPRFGGLLPVLGSLLAQNPAPERIYLCLPRSFERFSGIVALPDLPEGAEILWSDADMGPATKVLPAARKLAGSGIGLIYCDDDWIMPPGWAAVLLETRGADEAVTGAGYTIDRLGRMSGTGPPFTDIAQGFSGVLVNPDWIAGDELDPPEVAWPVDDIWLSGHLARQGIPIRAAHEARDGMALAHNDAFGLQGSVIAGRGRDAANRACAKYLHQKYGIWPPVAEAPVQPF